MGQHTNMPTTDNIFWISEKANYTQMKTHWTNCADTAFYELRAEEAQHHRDPAPTRKVIESSAREEAEAW